MQLRSLLDIAAIEAELNKAVSAGTPPQDVLEQFESWLQELMCDALAATLTGPSFLFAAVVFLPAIGQAILGSHPYPRDRIGFALRVLDRHSWTPILQTHANEILQWCAQLVGNPELTHSPLEDALRAATQLAEGPMMELAENVASSRVTSTDFLSAETALFGALDLEIPPVSKPEQPVGPWLLLTTGWLHEIKRSTGEGASALPRIASDRKLNRFLLKSIELSGIVNLWGASGASSS